MFNWKRNIPNSTSKGANQESIPIKTTTGEPRRNHSLKFIPIKVTMQKCRTCEGPYCGGIPIVNTAGAQKKP